MSDLSYSFYCPGCHSNLTIGQAMEIAAGILTGDFKGEAACPHCGFFISWHTPGKLEGRQWWKVLRENGVEYKPHPCAHCGRKIDGKRKHCNDSCRSMAAYRRKHPEVKRVKRVKHNLKSSRGTP